MHLLVYTDRWGVELNPDITKHAPQSVCQPYLGVSGAQQASNAAAGTSESTSEHRAVPANRSVPTSPMGTPRATPRHAGFSQHPVPPIAETLSAAAAALGPSSSLRQISFHAGPAGAVPFCAHRVLCCCLSIGDTLNDVLECQHI